MYHGMARSAKRLCLAGTTSIRTSAATTLVANPPTCALNATELTCVALVRMPNRVCAILSLVGTDDARHCLLLPRTVRFLAPA
jgi:hypothetical protein